MQMEIQSGSAGEPQEEYTHTWELELLIPVQEMQR